MSDTNLYKCVPNGWAGGNNFLLCTKDISFTSYGRQIVLYTVVKKSVIIGINHVRTLTDSLKGCFYTPNELCIIQPYLK